MTHAQPSPPIRSLPTWVLGLMAAAFVLRCIVLFENATSSQALAIFTPDDSYYYYVPVRNLITGHGITFDGTRLTNGFHPLWFAILVPIFTLFQAAGPDTPIIAAMVVASMFMAAAGGFLWSAIRRITESTFIAGVLVAIFLFNPYLVNASLNGLETGVHVLCITALLWWLARLYEQAELTARDIIVLGVLIALTFLSRTDSVILLGILMAFLLLARLNVRRLGQMIAAGAVAGIVVAPWLLWNYANFGSIIQSSGTPLTLFARRVWDIRTAGVDPISTLVYAALGYTGLGLRFAGFSWIPFVLVIFPVLIVALRHRSARRSWRGFVPVGQARWLAIVALYCLGYIAFNTIVRWFMRDWYFTGPVVVYFTGIAVILAVYLRTAREFLGRDLPLTAVTGGAFAVLLTLGWIGELQNPLVRYWGKPAKFLPQAGMFEAAQWLPTNTPEDAKFGSFNAGIVSYYGQRAIINLDGLMNQAVQPYIAKNKVLCYLLAADLDYIVDFDEVFDNWQPLFTPDLSVNSDQIRSASTPVFSTLVYEDRNSEPKGYAVVKFDKARLRELGDNSCP